MNKTDEIKEFHFNLKKLNYAAHALFRTVVYKETSLFPDLNRHEIRELVALTDALVDRHAPSINVKKQ